MNEEGRRRGMLQKGLDILQCLSDASESMSLSEVSQHTQLDRSTAHRLLQILVDERMVYQNPDTRAYRPHVGLLQLAGSAIANAHRGRNISQYLEHLREVTGESASYHVPLDVHRLCLEEAESRHGLRMTSTVGRVRPLCAGAAGKAIVAFLPSDELQSLVGNPVALGSWLRRERDFLESLDVVRERGYATSHEETTEGARAIAAPIRDFRGRVVGSLNVAGPATRFLLPGSEHELARLLLGTARKASEDRGYTSRRKDSRLD